MVTKRCEQCKYFGTVAYEEPCCDYCFKTGKMRGCPSGDKCVRFERNKEHFEHGVERLSEICR